MTGVWKFLFYFFSYLVLVYFLLLNAFYLFFVILSFFGIIRHRARMEFISIREVFLSPLAKPISIIAPAHNEENSIVESVRNLLSLEYPRYELVVVNDGSTDSTLQRLIDAFHLQKTQWVFRKIIDSKPIRGIYVNPAIPKLIVVDKVNGKKADALNAGINISHFPLVCAIDADCIIDRDSLLRVIRPYLEDPERTIAVGGTIRLANGCLLEHGEIKKVGLPKSNVARFQLIEYFRAFLGGRVGMSMVNSILIVSGAFGVFRKDLVLKVGGYRHASIGEDLDLVVRIRKLLHEQKTRYRIDFLPDPLCWTEAPESMKILGRQRNRWQRGLIECLLFNRRMIFNPRYGLTGMFVLPFYLIFEMFSPLVEVFGYMFFFLCVFFNIVDYPFAVIFFLLSVVLGTLLSISSLLLEEYSQKRFPRTSEVLLLALFCIIENFYYRQYLAVTRCKAFYDFFKGKKDWGVMNKKGFTTGTARS